MTTLEKLEQLNKELKSVQDMIFMNEMANDYYYTSGASDYLEEQESNLKSQIKELQAQL